MNTNHNPEPFSRRCREFDGSVAVDPKRTDENSMVLVHFEIPSQPAFVIIDAEGNVVTTLGAVDETALDTMLANAVG